MTTRDPVFNFEVVKLLLQAAWADLHLAPEEAELILSHAGKVGLLPDQLELVRSCLTGKRRLPPPDLGMLRLHRDEVLEIVKRLFMADDQLVPDEEALLQEMEQMLA